MQRGGYFCFCVRVTKRCFFLKLGKGRKEVDTSGVVLGVQRGAYFWSFSRGAYSWSCVRAA